MFILPTIFIIAVIKHFKSLIKSILPFSELSVSTNCLYLLISQAIAYFSICFIAKASSWGTAKQTNQMAYEVHIPKTKNKNLIQLKLKDQKDKR